MPFPVWLVMMGLLGLVVGCGLGVLHNRVDGWRKRK